MLAEDIKTALQKSEITWQKHALQRMFERNIRRGDVKLAILNGAVIEDYSDDSPYPSVLIAKIDNENALHVVVAYNADEERCYIITAYIPDEKHFENDLITRRDK